MYRHGRHLNWAQRATCTVIAALVLTSANASDVPESVGPQGVLVWESPREIPELNFEGVQGAPLSLKDFQGKVLLLNVWATWCAPCREEMPTLDALQARLGGSDFEVLALSIDHAGLAVVEEFYEKVGVEHLRRYIDRSSSAMRVFGIQGVPTTLLIDNRGREIGRLTGVADWNSPGMVEFLQDTMTDGSR